MAAEEKEQERKQIVVVLVRGTINSKQEVKGTLTMLRLYRKNYCVLLNPTPSILGMVKRVSRHVTWGEIDEPTLKLLKERRTETTKSKEGKEITRPFFRLQPPRKGFGRKGIKIPFKLGGGIGYRGDKINDLIQRMIEHGSE